MSAEIPEGLPGSVRRAGNVAVLTGSGISVEDVVVEPPETGGVPPPCPKCGAPLRPDVAYRPGRLNPGHRRRE